MTKQRIANYRAENVQLRAQSLAHHESASQWHLHVTLVARSRFCPGKAGGKDAAVPEILLTLPASVVCVVHSLFLQRLAGEPASWRQLLIIFIDKARGAQVFEEYRGITLT